MQITVATRIFFIIFPSLKASRTNLEQFTKWYMISKMGYAAQINFWKSLLNCNSHYKVTARSQGHTIDNLMIPNKLEFV